MDDESVLRYWKTLVGRSAIEHVFRVCPSTARNAFSATYRDSGYAHSESRYLKAGILEVFAQKNGRPMPWPDEPLLKPVEAAEYLSKISGKSVPVNTLGWWRSKGTGPLYIRLAEKTIRYAEADLDAFADKKR